MNSPYSGIRSQLQKSSKKRPGSSGRLATSARGLGSGEIALDAALDEGDLVEREGAAHTDGAVTAEGFDELGTRNHLGIVER